MLSSFHTTSLLDRMFDDVMGSTFGTSTAARAFSPTIDVRSTEKELAFVCDVPGVAREDLDVSLANHVLTLKGVRRYAAQEGEQVLLGRAYGSFTRTFALPDGLDEDALAATLADGVLTVRIPRHPKAMPRKIAIDSGSGNGNGSPKQLDE